MLSKFKYLRLCRLYENMILILYKFRKSAYLSKTIYSKWLTHHIIKSCLGKRSIQSAKQTNELQCYSTKNSLTWFKDSTLELLRNHYLLSFDEVSKMNTHNYLKWLNISFPNDISAWGQIFFIYSSTKTT